MRAPTLSLASFGLLQVLFTQRVHSQCSYRGWDFSTEFGSETFQLEDNSNSGWSAEVTPCGNSECTQQSGSSPALSWRTVSTLCSSELAFFDDSGTWSFTNGHNHNDGITVFYNNGPICPSGFNVENTVTINFVCSEGNSVTPQASSENNSCDWVFTLPSSVVCRSGGGLSAGWIFTIVIVSVAVGYLMIGFVYSWKVKGTPLGPESMPHREFWSDVPGLVKDGFTFVIDKARGDSYTKMADTNYGSA